MLNFVYYPVSGILWVWHTVIGGVLGPASGGAWALSVVLLVCTLRAVLVKPFISQVRSMRKMQEFQPQIKNLQDKYKGDRAKLAEEMQKLQREHGVSPLGGCLPVLLQVPVFIGLLQVLKGFQPSFPDNYVFDRVDIASFLDADLFGARLSESIAGGAQALGHISLADPTFAPHVVPVALPLMVLAAAATHITARVSQRRQRATAEPVHPQSALLGHLTRWVFPLGVLVGGVFFPVAMLLYWLTNNCWTLAQHYLVNRRLDREEHEQARMVAHRSRTRAPRPGQKPRRHPERSSASNEARGQGVQRREDQRRMTARRPGQLDPLEPSG